MRAKKGDLEVLNKYFDTEKDFKLTQEEYEKQTGGRLSNNLNYIKNRSALAEKANNRGFYLEIKPLEIKPMEIYFRKK